MLHPIQVASRLIRLMRLFAGMALTTGTTLVRERIAGDDIMLKELRRLPSPTCRERFERFFVYPLLWIKRQAVALWFLIKR